MSIPTFIIEEHHEAFIVWYYAIQQGLIPPTGNTLFHIDEHSDMGTPRFNKSIHELNGNIDQVKEFTYSELNIAGFIIPAVYKEIINEVYWIRQHHKSSKKNGVEMFVRSYNKRGTRLISGKTKNIEKDISDIDRKEFKYYLREVEQLPKKNNVILDIDLDYFSCSGNPNEIEEIYIEITKNEYENFIKNRYHRLNYSNLGKVDAIIKENKYYYVLNNYKEIYQSNLKVEENTIKDRIGIFIENLKRINITPCLINICRSRYSGYTPSDQWVYIEDELIKQLKSIYTLDIIKEFVGEIK